MRGLPKKTVLLSAVAMAMAVTSYGQRMDAILLTRIEELTLYQIEIANLVESQQEEIATLRKEVDKPGKRIMRTQNRRSKGILNDVTQQNRL